MPADVHTLPVIGVVQGEAPTELSLARAAKRQPGWSVRSVGVDEPASEALAGLVVDVPLDQRAAVLERLVPRYRVPILSESPVAADLQHARALASQAASTLCSANPLRYALHTRRLLETLAGTPDPLQSFFAAWRFRAEALNAQALPQLLDYLAAVCPDRLERVSAMRHRESPVTLVTLRYASDVLGSLEVGGRLPDSFPSSAELVVECFCASSAYVCLPGNQAVSLYGRDGAGAFDWQPPPAEAIVAAFAAWLGGKARPDGQIASDLAALGVVERIGVALESDAVLDGWVV